MEATCFRAQSTEEHAARATARRCSQGAMNRLQKLHDRGQSLWLDNITRALLSSGTLSGYIAEYAVTGLTSNPTIFDHAIRKSDAYDDAIRAGTQAGKSAESVFFDLALEDLTRAADLFLPAHRASNGLDGWVSLEVSPLLADDTQATLQAASELHRRAARPNLFIKIPGTPAGIPAIEEAIYAGVPVNVTLLFSDAHYVAAAEAYMRGIERRIADGRDPQVGSVASLFVSRWDVAVANKVPQDLHNRLGVAIAKRTYRAHRELLESTRWRRLGDAGAQAQRIVWASTGTKDPQASDTLYIDALAAPDTVNTMPENTLLAFAEHGHADLMLAADGGDAEEVIAEFAGHGVDAAALATELQRKGAQAFSDSWNDLLACIADKANTA
jgi:transaldolase